jgi:hypothetical protein
MNKDTLFYDKVTNDFDRYSYFLSIQLQSSNGKGRFIIENDDLYNYLQQSRKIDKEQYKKMIKDKLMNRLPLEINNNPTSNFIKIPEIESVNASTKKGIDEFIEIYFENEKVLKDGVTDNERTVIIQKLFEWGIMSKIDDETGYLILSR